jgi:hypothetical protein
MGDWGIHAIDLPQARQVDRLDCNTDNSTGNRQAIIERNRYFPSANSRNFG